MSKVNFFGITKKLKKNTCMPARNQKTSKQYVRDVKKCVTSKNQIVVKIDADYTIRCRMYMIEAVPVLIWSETDQNKHFYIKTKNQKNSSFPMES